MENKSDLIVVRFRKYLLDWDLVRAEHRRLRNRLPIIGLFFEIATSRKLEKISDDYERDLKLIDPPK